MKIYDLSAEKAAEEIKRRNRLDPLEQWKRMQRMMSWIETYFPLEKRRNRPRWHSWEFFK